MTYQQEISIAAKGHGHMYDLTGQVAAVVNASGVKTGLVQVCNVGSTAGVGTIEFEPGLERDLPAILDKLIPPIRSYGHEQAWQEWTLASASNLAGSVAHRADCGRPAPARNLAADFSFGLRHSAAAEDGGSDGDGRVKMARHQTKGEELGSANSR